MHPQTVCLHSPNTSAYISPQLKTKHQLVGWPVGVISHTAGHIMSDKQG